MLRVPRISQATARNRAMSRALLTTRLDSRLFPSGHGPWIWPGRGNLCQQVTFDLKSGGRLAGVAVDLNGEVPGGPLDAFFMSRPRYTQRENDLASRLALSLSLSLSLDLSLFRSVRSVRFPFSDDAILRQHESGLHVRRFCFVASYEKSSSRDRDPVYSNGIISWIVLYRFSVALF